MHFKNPLIIAIELIFFPMIKVVRVIFIKITVGVQICDNIHIVKNIKYPIVPIAIVGMQLCGNALHEKT